MITHRPKIRVLLCGGLGNQLFQYAFGRAVASHFDADLELDIETAFERDLVYRRSYELSAFKLFDELELIRPSKLGRLAEWTKLAFARRGWAFTDRYIIEPSGSNIWSFPDALQRGRYTTFGYWQSEHYFSAIKAQLRKDFQFRRQLSSRNQALAEEMEASSSVAIHVRRAQYNSKLDLSYYERAIKEMGSRFSDAQFYCFSDDADWCRDNLASQHEMKIIDNKDQPAIEDFQLMTHCRHFVIANSSFSWWAAYLGGNNAVVLAPRFNMSGKQTLEGHSPWHWVGI